MKKLILLLAVVLSSVTMGVDYNLKDSGDSVNLPAITWPGATAGSVIISPADGSLAYTNVVDLFLSINEDNFVSRQQPNWVGPSISNLDMGDHNIYNISNIVAKSIYLGKIGAISPAESLMIPGTLVAGINYGARYFQYTPNTDISAGSLMAGFVGVNCVQGIEGNSSLAMGRLLYGGRQLIVGDSDLVWGDLDGVDQTNNGQVSWLVGTGDQIISAGVIASLGFGKHQVISNSYSYLLGDSLASHLGNEIVANKVWLNTEDYNLYNTYTKLAAPVWFITNKTDIIQKYIDDTFLRLDGTKAMTGNLTINSAIPTIMPFNNKDLKILSGGGTGYLPAELLLTMTTATKLQGYSALYTDKGGDIVIIGGTSVSGVGGDVLISGGDGSYHTQFGDIAITGNVIKVGGQVHITGIVDPGSDSMAVNKGYMISHDNTIFTDAVNYANTISGYVDTVNLNLDGTEPMTGPLLISSANGLTIQGGEYTYEDDWGQSYYRRASVKLNCINSYGPEISFTKADEGDIQTLAIRYINEGIGIYDISENPATLSTLTCADPVYTTHAITKGYAINNYARLATDNIMLGVLTLNNDTGLDITSEANDTLSIGYNDNNKIYFNNSIVGLIGPNINILASSELVLNSTAGSVSISAASGVNITDIITPTDSALSSAANVSYVLSKVNSAIITAEDYTDGEIIDLDATQLNINGDDIMTGSLVFNNLTGLDVTCDSADTLAIGYDSDDVVNKIEFNSTSISISGDTTLSTVNIAGASLNINANSSLNINANSSLNITSPLTSISGTDIAISASRGVTITDVVTPGDNDIDNAANVAYVKSKSFEELDNVIIVAESGGEYISLANAIAAALSGDTILVAPGTYNIAVAISITKNITIKGIGTRGSVILNSSVSTKRLFKLSTANKVLTLENLTLTSVDDSNGGAICVEGDGSRLISINCIYLNCSADGNGGAIFVNPKGSISIDNNIFDTCTVDIEDSFGGGIYISSTDAKNSIIKNTEFKNCRAYTGGGARLSSSPGLIHIYNCLFTDCYAANYGGGVSIGTAGIRMDNCTFDGNSAAVLGGGIYVNYETMAPIYNCIGYVDSDTVKHQGGTAHFINCYVNGTIVP